MNVIRSECKEMVIDDRLDVNCVNCREYWKYDSHCGLTGNTINIVQWDFGDYGDDEFNCPLLKRRNT